MNEFDVIVVGAGSGLDVASAYASRGKDVAVVEPGPLGGTCLNRGCIPSKMLIHHADIVEEVERAENFHVDAEINNIDFSTIIDEVNEEVSQESKNIRKGIESSNNHTLFREEAKFIDEKVMEVKGQKIKAEKIIVAAGSRPLIPPVDGLEEVDYLTSEEALQLEELPDEMLIIGGGYISLELAYFYSRMGSEITILEMQDRLLAREDTEISERITEVAEEAYDVNLGFAASEVSNEGEKISVIAEDQDGNQREFNCNQLLVAAGRKPNSDRLNVEEAGIETDDRGFIVTDEFMETSVDGIYALGDIAGNWMFKHSANLEAKYAFRNSFSGNEHELDGYAMPHAVFTHPQIAGVGKTEQELEEEDAKYVSAKYDYSDTGMGMAMKAEGFVKVLADADGEILGCHIIGPQASTLIHEVLVAMRAGNSNVEDIQDTIHIHPALNEVVQRAFNQI